MNTDPLFDPEIVLPEGQFPEDDEAPPTENVVDLDLWIDKRLRALRAIRRQMEQNRAVYERMVAEAENWLAEQNAPLERRYNYLEERLKHVARIYPYSGKTKSRALPNGTIKLRTEPERLSVVNVSTAAAWAETIPELAEAVEVTVTKRIRQSVLQDYWRSTGIVPEGCEIVPSEIKAYVQLGDDR